jgi:MFS superfamily sulfate permease-like transporter
LQQGALVPVLLFLTGPLQYIPSVALAAILIYAATSMLNWDDLRAIHHIEPQEFWLAMIATAGVLVFGAIQAILLVVVIAVLRFVRLTARPRVEILVQLDAESFDRASRRDLSGLITGIRFFPTLHWAELANREETRGSTVATPD